MLRHVVPALLVLMFALRAQTTPDAAELTRLLQQFLSGASSDPAVHARFWADDLIYTGSSGRRIGKADILAGLRSESSHSSATYAAEDIRIQQYGDTAIVAFRLVATAGNTVSKYFNTGTFLKRHGVWQAVSWQATRIPRPEDQARKEVAAAHEAFHRALAAGDVNELAWSADESFVWTRETGEQTTRKSLLDQLRSGPPRYSQLKTDNVSISVYGDSAVVRGVSHLGPATGAYTMTFVSKDGEWKAVALHASGL